LGEISEDILDYLSSRKADQRIFLADLLVDRAHLMMLKERGLISEEVASRSLLLWMRSKRDLPLGLERMFMRPLRRQSLLWWVLKGGECIPAGLVTMRWRHAFASH